LRFSWFVSQRTCISLFEKVYFDFSGSQLDAGSLAAQFKRWVARCLA